MEPIQKETLQAKAGALFPVWRKAWQTEIEARGFRVLEIEVEFNEALINPDSDRASRTFREAGKMDAILEDKDGGIWLGEHKTSTEDVSPGSDYWDRLRIDTQISKYLLALMQRYPDRNVMGVVYDVTRKPLQRLGSVPLVDADGIKIVLDSAGQRALNKNGTPRQSPDAAQGYSLQTRPETVPEFSARLAEVVSNPSDWISIQRVGRLDGDLVEYMRDAWAASQQILYWRRQGIWPRNPEACTAYGRCEFWDICAGRATVDGVRFASAAKNKELDQTEAEGLDLLTNSRMRALRKCARFHFHRYETPIEKVGEEREALWFGSLWHDLLETYLRSTMAEAAA